MEQLNRNYTGTVYRHCTDPTGYKYLELPKWIAQIRSDVFKSDVLEYRQLLAAGKKNEAQAIKKRLAAYVCSAQCMRTRKKGMAEGYSQVVMADYDFHNGAWTKAQGCKLQPVAWVLAYHATVSEGLRVFCRLVVEDESQFEAALNQLLAELDAIVGYHHDEKTVDRLRLSYASYDPDAWCRADWQSSEPFPLRKDELTFTEKPDNPVEQPIPAVAPAVENPAKSEKTDDELIEFLEKRLAISPFVAGKRNHTIGFVGLQAADNHFSKPTVARLATLMGMRCYDTEYPAPLIAKEVMRAYNSGLRTSATSTSSTYGGATVDEAGQKDPIPATERKVVREECPTFPEAVYQLLPEFFAQLLEPAKSAREKDYLLGGILTVSSAMLPNLKIRMREKDYSAHLGLLIIAPAGSGKGVALYPRLLAEPLDRRFRQEAEAIKEKYKQAKQEWDDECRLAFTQKRKTRKELDPGVMPDVPIFCCPTRCSRSVFIRALAASPHGVLMMTSELDTSTESMKADCGHFASDLRLAFMNEVTEQAYLCDGKAISSYSPKLAFLASGTPDQLGSFLNSIDNGLMSRLFIYLGEGAQEWISLCGYSKENREKAAWKAHYEAVGQQFITLFDYLKEHPTLAVATEDQNAYMDDFFRQRLKLVNGIESGEKNSSLVTRGCLLTHRVCAVLAGVRKALNQLPDTILYFTDDEVRLAIAMTQVYLQHELHAVTILPEKNGRRRLQSTYINASIFDRLPVEFTTEQFMAVCKELRNIKQSAAYALLSQWEKDGLIVRVRKGVYRKTGKSFPL